MLKFIKIVFVMLFASAFFACCNNGFSSAANPGISVKKIKQYQFLLQPLTSKELFNINYSHKTVNAGEEEKIIKEYDDFLCFRFEIQIEGFNREITEYYDKLDEKVNYEQLLNYYLFEMQQDLKLFSLKGDEIACNIFLYERTFDLTKSNRFIVGFKRNNKAQDITFSYNNRYLNIGKVNFQINKNDFKG